MKDILVSLFIFVNEDLGIKEGFCTYSDCCFVEDNAIVVENKAIINFLGAESRRKEVSGVEKALKEACILYKYSNFLPSDAKSCFI